tara:strand:+ start:8964 stop:11339 length:2376 start_codon:yes stop_codon:yes gene_type:complete
MIQLAVLGGNLTQQTTPGTLDGPEGFYRYLDLYKTNPILLNLSIEDITTTDTTAVYSQTFRIPATTNNNAFFISAFDINGFDFDISVFHKAQLIVDSNTYQVGEIRLLKVYHDKEGNQTDYEIVFLGSTRSFVSSLGETVLCELNLENLAHDFTIANVQDSWQAYPETPSTSTAGLLNGSVIYPLVDFGNSYTSNYVAEQPRIENGSAGSFTNAATPLTIDRLRPAIKCKDVWDKIFENSGYTYDSTFLDSNLFRHLYIGAFGDKADVIQTYTVYGYNWESTQGLVLGVPIIYDLTHETVTGTFDLPNNNFTAPSNAIYDFTSDVWITVEFTNPQLAITHDVTFTLKLIKDSGGVLSTLATTTEFWEVPPGNPQIVGFYRNIFAEVASATLLAGDKVYVEVEMTAENDVFSAVTDVYTAALGVKKVINQNPGLGLSCEMKQIDFIKGIIDKFRLVMAPDRTKTNNFIIEPWVDYIATGDVVDWTNKIDLSKDITVEPILYTQKQKITFEDKKGEDFLNVLNQTDIGEVYGTLNFNSNSPLLKDTRKITTEFEPVASIQIDGSSQTNNGMDNTIIPQIHDHEAEVDSSFNGVLLHNPCKPGVRIFWYDGLVATGTTAPRDNTWYLTDGVGSNSYTNFPMISQFSEWGDYNSSWGVGLDTQTQDLSWQQENTFILYGLKDPNRGNAIYQTYWSRYIQSLYSTFARRVTAYFMLSKEDLFDFSFDDAIFIKNSWYYVEKIHSLDLSKTTRVKVDLIKLDQNFIVPNTNFIAPGLMWEDAASNWEVGYPSNWEAV